eukprot:9972213-Alexandrium_andersonii.AAC.1
MRRASCIHNGPLIWRTHWARRLASLLLETGALSLTGAILCARPTAWASVLPPPAAPPVGRVTVASIGRSFGP